LNNEALALITDERSSSKPREEAVAVHFRFDTSQDLVPDGHTLDGAGGISWSVVGKPELPRREGRNVRSFDTFAGDDVDVTII
jgi:hypothetical protein